MSSPSPTSSPTRSRADDDASEDYDGDGLTNAEECAWGTNPSGADANGDGIPDGRDTDGDGVTDGAEIAQDSDPADATDEGKPGSRTPVSFYFGDHSTSHSEKYLLTVVPIAGSGTGTPPRAFSWVNANYGECETRTAMLTPGWSYEVRLAHASTKRPQGPDYDYTLNAVDVPQSVMVSDTGGLLGVHLSDSAFTGAGKAATLHVYKFIVEEISFNNDWESCTSDAVSLRKNARSDYDTVHGEWWTGGDSLKNDPVCYVGGIVPTVKVKFKVSPRIAYARLSAETVGTGTPLGGLAAQDVTFSDGTSTWVEFTADTSIPRVVRKADLRLAWRVSQIGGLDVSTFVCATTGPHRVYTVLGEPAEPWTPNGIDAQNPWADALELACTVANGINNRVSALAAVTSHLFHNMGFHYDVVNGSPHYFGDDHMVFSFNSYISRRLPEVNCSDQAYGLATFGNLIGIHSTIVMTQPIGYVNTVNLVGVGQCNNPVYLGADTTNHIAVCGEDDIGRSRLTRHRYVYAEGVIFDACFGPALGSQTNLEYLKSLIDSSADAERFWCIFAPFIDPPIPFKMNFETRHYQFTGGN